MRRHACLTRFISHTPAPRPPERWLPSPPRDSASPSMTGSSAPRCRTKPYTVPAQARRNSQGFNHRSHIRTLRKPCAAAWLPFLHPCPTPLLFRLSFRLCSEHPLLSSPSPRPAFVHPPFPP